MKGLNYKSKVEVNVTPKAVAATWARIAAGFSNIAEALNEVLFQGSDLDAEGWGHTDVTGAQLLFTLTGRREFGDVAQDYIFSDAVRFGFGEARETQLKITRQDGTAALINVTIVNPAMSGGDANKAINVSVAFHANGAPEIVTAGYLAPLTLVSVAGGSAGKTAIYVNPALTSGNSYKYKTAASVDMPAFNDVLTTGWTAWTPGTEITATAGHQIVLAEVVTATNVAQKAGRATVTVA